MGSSKRQIIGYKYFVGAHLVLGHGPFDRILRISVGDKVAWSAITDAEGRGSKTGYERININAPDLFGGKNSEGGVQGAIDIGMGYPAQPPNDYLKSRLSNIGNVPAYRDLVSVILRQVYVGMSPYLKNWTFRAQRIWAPIEGRQEQWIPQLAGIGENNQRTDLSLDTMLGEAVWINNQLWTFGHTIEISKAYSVEVTSRNFTTGALMSVNLHLATMRFWPLILDVEISGTKIMWPLCRTRDDHFCVMEFDTATLTWEERRYTSLIDLPGWGNMLDRRKGMISDQMSYHIWQPLGELSPIYTLIGPKGFAYTIRPRELSVVKLPTLGLVDWAWHPTAFHVLATDTYVEPVFYQHIACALVQKNVTVNGNLIRRFALHWINLDTGLPGNSDDLIPMWAQGGENGEWVDAWGDFSMKVRWPYAIICVPQIFAEWSTSSSRFWIVNIEQLQVLPPVGEHNLGLPRVKTVGAAVGSHNAITEMMMDPDGCIHCVNMSEVWPGYLLRFTGGKYDLPVAEFYGSTYSNLYAWDYKTGKPTGPDVVTRAYAGAREVRQPLPWFYAKVRSQHATPAWPIYGSGRTRMIASRGGVPVVMTGYRTLVWGGDRSLVGTGAQDAKLYESGKTYDEMSWWGWTNDAAMYFMTSGGNGISRVRSVSGGNWDMNPAHIIRECMTNKTWGRGLPESLIGPTFAEVAGRLYDEGLGMSLLWTSEVAVDEFIAEILRTIDAIRYEDPVTGQQEIKLIRGGYDDAYVAGLPVLGPDNSESEQVVKPPVYELVNQVTVTYWNRSTGETGCVTVQDTAAINQVGSVNAQAMEYVGITRGDNALAVATRDLGSLSKPFAKGKLTTNRRVADLIPGDLFVLNDPASGIEQMVCRVGRRIDNGALDGRIGIEWGQDVFGTAFTTTATPPDSGWVDPVPAPVNFTNVGAFEIPYPMLVQDVGDTTASRLPDDIAYLGFAGTRPPSGVLLDYEMWDYAEGDTNIGSGTIAVFTPIGSNWSTVSGLGVFQVGAPTIEIIMPGTNSSDLDQVQAGDMAVVWRAGTGVVEWIEAVGAPVYDETANAYTLWAKRAVAGSVPKQWSAETDKIMWVGSIYGSSRDEWTDGMAVSAFGRPKNSKGSYAGDPTVLTVDMQGWAGRPYAAANVRVNDYYVLPDDAYVEVTVTWARRNRLSQSHNGVSWFDPTDYPPEDGTKYLLTIQGRDAAGADVGDPVVRDLGTATSYTLDRLNDLPAEAKRVHLTLVTERNGLAAVVSSSFDVKLHAVLTAPFRLFSYYDRAVVPPVVRLMPYNVQADDIWEAVVLARPVDVVADFEPTVIYAPVDVVADFDPSSMSAPTDVIADYDGALDAPTRVSIRYNTALDAPSRVSARYVPGPAPLTAPVDLLTDFEPTVIFEPADVMADFDTALDAPSRVSARYDTALAAPMRLTVRFTASPAPLTAPADVVADFQPTVIYAPSDIVADVDTSLDAPFRLGVSYSTRLDAPARVRARYAADLAAPADVVADFQPTVIYAPSDATADFDTALDAPVLRRITYSTRLAAPSAVRIQYK